MASQQMAPAGSCPSAQVVGNAFVHQYYHILHQSPELVHRFYQETSKLGRPEAQGVMSSITTMKAINEKIISMDYSEFRAEIKTVDAQESLGGGVIVLVTGYLTAKDNVNRNFTQSFFLAPQDKGYFVLNDILRYVEEADHQQGNQGLENGTSTPLLHNQESSALQKQQDPEQTLSPPEEEDEVNVVEADNLPDNEEGSAVEEEVPVDEVIDEVPNSSQAAAHSSSTTRQEEVPKKSYASIVKVMKENTALLSVPVPASARPAPANPERMAASVPPPDPAPEILATSSNATESGSAQEAEADGHSIYIRSLPLNATPAQLEDEFRRFGPIKPGGIQVRSHKQQGFCFGFVEFEVASAVQSAIEASPIMIGGRQAYVEEKRPGGSRVNNRGRFANGRGGGFRNDGIGGRGNYVSGRGYGRSDFNNRADFGNRAGGRGASSNHGGDSAYQRVDYMGSNVVRGNRPGSLGVNLPPTEVAPRVPAPA